MRFNTIREWFIHPFRCDSIRSSRTILIESTIRSRPDTIITIRVPDLERSDTRRHVWLRYDTFIIKRCATLRLDTIDYDCGAHTFHVYHDSSHDWSPIDHTLDHLLNFYRVIITRLIAIVTICEKKRMRCNAHSRLNAICCELLRRNTIRCDYHD